MRSLDVDQRSVWIRHSCVAGASFWFKGDPPFYSQTKHMFFVLGKPDDNHFLMVNATSQVSSRLHHLGRKLRSVGVTAQDVSVHLPRGSYSFITKDTLIDCSDPFLMSVEDLINGDELALFDAPPSPQFFAPLLNAWAASPLALTPHLNQVRPQWSAHGITF